MAESPDNPYKRLQVDPSAEPEVVRAAYHALARKRHPDAGGDGEAMVLLNAAWAILRDPVSRAAYDAGRAHPVAGPTPRPDPAPQTPPRGDAAPLVRRRGDRSSTLDFGRYAGWSLAQLAATDPSYLRWLIRTPIGRRLAVEAEALLETSEAASSSAVGRPRPIFGTRPGGRPELGLAGRLGLRHA
ncbi:MAG TPA: DnaJ domain-containing protein [Steroidobacteraceae bacterium]|nr:DnaJ domain-containing protein [Steroidobacteraceae bacterium]